MIALHDLVVLLHRAEDHRAHAVLVFSEEAAELLRAAEPGWGDRRCRVVPHGAPAELPVLTSRLAGSQR